MELLTWHTGFGHLGGSCIIKMGAKLGNALALFFDFASVMFFRFLQSSSCSVERSKLTSYLALIYSCSSSFLCKSLRNPHGQE